MIYWFTALTNLCLLIGISYNCLQSFSTLEILTRRIKLIKKGEHQLKRCGQLAALTHNLIDSYDILRQQRKNHMQLKKTYLHLLAQLTPYRQEPPCTTSALPNLTSIAHQETNPNLPLFWPNWTVRHQKQTSF